MQRVSYMAAGAGLIGGLIGLTCGEPVMVGVCLFLGVLNYKNAGKYEG